MIPCKYVVAKYVGDEVRDEPINVGIILQSQENNYTTSKFISRFSKIRTTDEEPAFLKKIVENIYDNVSVNRNKKNILYDLAKNFESKIRFTEPRGTLTKDITKEINSLYDRYVSIEKQSIPRTEVIKVTTIKKYVWNYIHIDMPRFQRRVLIPGLKSQFTYDFVFGENKKIFHSISFDAQDSLKKTKLFDWHVIDVLSKNGLTKSNFGTIVSEPSEANPKYTKVKEQYKEGIKILKSKYDIVIFDEDNGWKKEIKKLVA